MTSNGQYLRNCWYVAAWAHDVYRLHMMRRVMLGEPVVLYRKKDGAPVALEDRCVHRHAPLSHGRMKGDNIECAYHGLIFDPAGKCIHIPSQDNIPPTACVKSYPVAEKYQWIWVWMGDPAKADEALIPDFHWMDDPDCDWRGETLHVKGNYLLVVENLMDLSHLPALHVGTLADTHVPENDSHPLTDEVRGNDLHLTRWISDVETPPYFSMMTDFKRGDRVDRWMDTHFTPPSYVRLDIGAAPVGDGSLEGDRSGTRKAFNLNAVTPETETTCHYFWAQAQNFAQGDNSITEIDFKMTQGAFQQDVAIIQGQQENMDLNPDSPRLNLAADKYGLQATRTVEKLIREEQKAAG